MCTYYHSLSSNAIYFLKFLSILSTKSDSVLRAVFLDKALMTEHNVSVSNTNGNFKICVGARPQRATVAVKASEFLSNNELNNENIIKASKIAAEELSFGSNMRASREYRKAICISLVKNALMEVSSCQIQ